MSSIGKTAEITVARSSGWRGGVFLAGPALARAHLFAPERSRSMVGVRAVGLFMAASRKDRAGLIVERKV